MMRRLDENDAEVRALNGELVRSSHWAGMAEVAAGVLHSVGNVLNSVNVSADVLTERSRRLRAESLAKIVAMLEGAHADLPGFFADARRAEHVLAYLRELSSTLGLDREGLIEQCELLKGQIAHLAEFIASFVILGSAHSRLPEGCFHTDPHGRGSVCFAPTSGPVTRSAAVPPSGTFSTALPPQSPREYIEKLDRRPSVTSLERNLAREVDPFSYFKILKC
jgi:hypothetical protein